MSSTHEVMNQLPISQTFGDFTLFENADTGHDDAALGSSFSTSALTGKSDDDATVQCLSESGLFPTLDVEGSSPETAAVPWDERDWEVAGSLLAQADWKDGMIRCMDAAPALDQDKLNELCAELLESEATAAPLFAPMDGLSASLQTDATHQPNSFFAQLDEIVPHTPTYFTPQPDQSPLTNNDLDDLWSELCDSNTAPVSSPLPALLSPTESNITADCLSPLFSPLISPMGICASPISPQTPSFLPLSPCADEEVTLHVTKVKDARIDEIDKITKSEDGFFYCPDCERPFERRFNLKTHYAAKHAAMREFGCGVCERSFARKYDMVRHMKTKHGKIGHVVVNGRISKVGERKRMVTPVVPKSRALVGIGQLQAA